MRAKSKKIVLITAVSILLVICAAMMILQYKGYRNYADVRKTVDTVKTSKTTTTVGKDNIYINCCGKGEPAVIFESGLWCGIASWSDVQPEISKITRTFSYDRMDDGRTTLDQVHELHTLLEVNRVKKPYIIVAHSIGGLNARLFAGTYPGEVAGIVFVDSSHENQYSNPNFGYNTPPFTTDAEQVKEIRKKDALRNIPIIVLTADKEDDPDIKDDWLNYQNDIASLSNKSKHIVLHNSSHFIQTDHPDVVIDAIKEIIKEIKK